MSRVLRTVTLATGLALASATPGIAGGLDRDDVARALLGVAAAALIAKAIDDRNDRKKKTASAGSKRQAGQGFGYSSGAGLKGRVVDGDIRYVKPHHGWKDKGQGVKRRPLPVACRVIVDTARGKHAAYVRSCLSQRYKHARQLPSHCETLVRTKRGYHSVFGARCLDRDGWRFAAR